VNKYDLVITWNCVTDGMFPLLLPGTRYIMNTFKKRPIRRTLHLSFHNTSFSMPSTPGIKFMFSHFVWHIYCTTVHQTTVHSTPISLPEFCQATLQMFLQRVWSIILPTTQMALLILICLSTLITHMPVQTADLFVGSTTAASMSASNTLKYRWMLQTEYRLSHSSACKKTYHQISVI
jgi:hypothetical protein